MPPQRLPVVGGDDAVWGDILRAYLLKEHYETAPGDDNPANGGHKTITIRPGTASAGTAPLKFSSGTNMTAPEAGAIEYDGNFHITLAGNARTTVVGTDASQTLTNKTLTAPRVDEIRDTAGNPVATITGGGTANYMSVANANGGGYPGFTAQGSDANVGLYFRPKGSGAAVYISQPSGNTTAVITAQGVDANITLNLTTKGTGTVQVNGVDAVTVSGAQTLTNKTLTNPNVNNYVEGVVAIGTVTTTHTFNLTNGTLHTATLTASTACTFTMPALVAGKSFTVLLKQAAVTGNGSATFTGVKWAAAGAPTITATAGRMDILTFVSDGASWYGSFVQGYTP